MTAPAPALSAAWANARWRAFSLVARSTPQWNVATTTSARRRAARTPAAIAGNVALDVPGRPGPAKNDGGPMSEKPDERDPQPEAGDDLGRARGRQRRARADRHGARGADGAHGVQQRRHAEVAGVVVGEVEHVEAGEAHDRGEVARAAAEVELLRHRGAAIGDRALEVAEGDVGAPQRRRDAAPRMQGAALLA